MCHQLAAQGFNVCIVARNAKKIDEKLAEIKAKYPSVETKSIIADFTKLFTIEEYKTNIADHCQDMDVAIFALNAGITRIGFYDGIPDMDVQDNVMCNALHPCYLAKAITPMMTGRMDKKKQKSAMIFVSSMAQDVPAPGNLTYSAAKIFCSYIAEGLSYEFEGKVDVINYMPAVVKTNIFKPEDMETSHNDPSAITATEAVSSIFRDLGIDAMTYGDIKHRNLHYMMGGMSKNTMMKMANDGMRGHLAK